jgi:hemoglobin-like flavoprotein
MFPDDIEHQRKKLMQTLAWVVTDMDRPAQIVPALRELGRRHAEYGSKAEHYPLVRDTLIDAMARTAGADWNHEIAEDWRQSIDLIGRHMIAGAADAARDATSTALR